MVFTLTYQRKLIFVLIPILIFCCSFLMLWFLRGGYSFGWDESVYLTKARSWIDGSPADTFSAYRPIGMVVFGWFFLHFGDSESIVRIFGVLFGALTLMSIFLLFQRIVNLGVALCTVLLIGSSPLFLQETTQFLNDIPSSGFLIAVLWIIWRYYDTSGKSRSIYFAAPAAALAFYLRYGVVLSFIIIGVSSLILLFKRRPIEDGKFFKKLRNTIFIFLVLMVPHFIYSILITGKLWGILTLSGQVAGRKYLGEGLMSYLPWLPSQLAGYFAGVSAMIGVITTFIILIRKTLCRDYPGLLWLGGIGMLTFFFTGLLVHAEPRYVFFSFVLLSGVGVSGIYFLFSERVKLRAVLLGVLAIFTLYFGITQFQRVHKLFKERELNLFSRAYVEAYMAIRSVNSEGEQCMVWTQQFLPQVSWYTKCNVSRYYDAAAFAKKFQVNTGKNHYTIFFSRSKEIQIQPGNAEKFGVWLTEVYKSQDLPQGYSSGDISIYRVTQQ